MVLRRSFNLRASLPTVDSSMMVDSTTGSFEGRKVEAQAALASIVCFLIALSIPCFKNDITYQLLVPIVIVSVSGVSAAFFRAN
jgi:hypothetical protein